MTKSKESIERIAFLTVYAIDELLRIAFMAASDEKFHGKRPFVINVGNYRFVAKRYIDGEPERVYPCERKSRFCSPRIVELDKIITALNELLKFGGVYKPVTIEDILAIAGVTAEEFMTLED